MLTFCEGLRVIANADAGADRETTAQAFGQRQHIGPYALVLMHEPRPGAADARLDLIQHQSSTGRVADGTGRAQVAVRRRDHTALTENGLEKHGGCLLGDGRGEGVGVAVRHESHVGTERAERLTDRRLSGQGQRTQRTAVETAIGRDDVGAPRPRVPPYQLVRRLVRLGAAVGEEHPAVDVEQSQQLFGQGDCRLVAEKVAGVGNRRHLARHCLDHGRMRMTEHRHGDAGDQVEIRAPVGVPDGATGTPDQRHGWRAARGGSRRVMRL